MDSSQVSGIKEIANERMLYTALRTNVLITVMNTTMFNVAIPSIAADFFLSPSLTSWVVTCYSVVFAIGTVTYGRLSDRFSIKQLLTFGLTMLGIGSLIGLFSSHFYLLLLARLIQAAGASCIPGLGMVITARYIPVERRGEAMGKITSAVTLGFGMGPLMGGIITEYLGWSYLFLITLLALSTLPIYRKYLPFEQTNSDSTDIKGLLLLSFGVVSFLLWISSGNHVFSLGIVLFYFLRKHTEKVEKPFISMELFKNKYYVIEAMVGFLLFFVNFSTLFSVPLLLAAHFKMSALGIGGIIFPGAFCSAIASTYIGRLLDRTGPHPVKMFGIGLMFSATVLLSSFAYFSPWLILCFYLLTSIGFASISTAIPNYISRILRKDQIGAGMGLLQLIQFFGGAFGVTFTGIILDSQVKLPHPINPLWVGSDTIFSNVFLFLVIVTSLSALIYKCTKNKLKEANQCKTKSLL